MSQPKDKDWLNGYQKKTPIYTVYKKSTSKQWTQKIRPLYTLSIRNPPQNNEYIQTESEGLEKGISHKWRSKESRSSNTHIG